MNPLEAAQLYDGTGRHVRDVYPPLMVDNQLTEVYHVEKAVRPYRQSLAVDPERAPLLRVWMMPCGIPQIASIPAAVLGELVQAIDDGGMVILHGDTQDAVGSAAAVVAALSGGGHA